MSKRLDERAVSEMTGWSIFTLRNDRTGKSGKRRIPYLKVGRRVFYWEKDVQAFLDSCRISGRR
jgi:hypothetical protein